jgi:hypothetical protein
MTPPIAVDLFSSWDVFDLSSQVGNSQADGVHPGMPAGRGAAVVNNRSCRLVELSAFGAPATLRLLLLEHSFDLPNFFSNLTGGVFGFAPGL